MNRKEFFQTSLLGAAAIAAASTGLTACCSDKKKGADVKLNLSFQEGIAPGESLSEKLTFVRTPLTLDSI